MIKGIIFDFSGTLAHRKTPRDFRLECKILRQNGYEVYYQEWQAAYEFTAFVEYPKGKIHSYEEFFKTVFNLLGIQHRKTIIK